MKYYFVIIDSQDLQKGQFLGTLKKLLKNQYYSITKKALELQIK